VFGKTFLSPLFLHLPVRFHKFPKFSFLPTPYILFSKQHVSLQVCLPPLFSFVPPSPSFFVRSPAFRRPLYFPFRRACGVDPTNLDSYVNVKVSLPLVPRTFNSFSLSPFLSLPLPWTLFRFTYKSFIWSRLFLRQFVPSYCNHLFSSSSLASASFAIVGLFDFPQAPPFPVTSSFILAFTMLLSFLWLEEFSLPPSRFCFFFFLPPFCCELLSALFRSVISWLLAARMMGISPSLAHSSPRVSRTLKGPPSCQCPLIRFPSSCPVV